MSQEKRRRQSKTVDYFKDTDDSSDESDGISDSGSGEWIQSQSEEVSDSDSSDSSNGDNYAKKRPGVKKKNQEPSCSKNSDDDDEDIPLASLSKKSVLGKDKKTEWSKSPFDESQTPARNVINLPANKTPNTSDVKTPMDAFLLYIDNKLLNIMIKFTNIEGQKKYKDAWKDIDVLELECFIGCLVHAGALHQNKHSLKTLFDPVDGNSLIRAAFSYHRFQELLVCMRFDDKSTRSVRKERDQFAAIRDFWDHWHSNLTKYFVAGENITVDEQLIPFRGRCSFLQYMPSKPDKYGLKIFWACDSQTAYPLNGIPYLGKDKTGRSPKRAVGLGESTVLELTKGFKGRNITCDNYFTTLDLVDKLKKEKMSLVGTVKRDKTFLPPDFKEKKALELYESRFVFRKDTVLVSYQSKRNKNVILMSSMHNDSAIDEEGEKKKPEVVLKYNQTKGGVDTLDQMAHSFTTKRKTKRWPLVHFFNILDLSTICARTVYIQKYPNDPLSDARSRQQFNIRIGRQLALTHIQRRREIPTLQNQVKENIEAVIKTLQPKEKKENKSKTKKRKTSDDNGPEKKIKKRCQICPTKADRKTGTQCPKCHLYICGEHRAFVCSNCAKKDK